MQSMNELMNELKKLDIPFEINEDDSLVIPKYEWMSNFAGVYSEAGHYTFGISKNGRWQKETFHDVYTLGEMVKYIARFYFEEREEKSS